MDEPANEWFPLVLRGGREESAFITRLRTLAPDLLDRFLTASDTAVHQLAGDLAVVDVPGVNIGNEQVVLELQWKVDRLEGHWSDDHYLWDEPLGDTQSVLASGTISAEVAAEIAVEWLEAQLVRPLQHESWTRKGKTVAERWTFKDTDEILAPANGHSFKSPASHTALVRG